MNKHKEFFSKTIAHFIPASFLDIFIKTTKQKIFVPFYHTIGNASPPHVKYLYPILNINQFEADIDFILKKFQPIDLKEVIDIIKNNKTVSKPVFHLTFDDGFSEFYHIIAPILFNKGVPATCFLNSDFIDNKNLFYRCKASLLIDKLHNETTGSTVWKKYHEFCSAENIPNSYYRNFLLSVGYDKKDFLDKLAIAIGLDFDKYLSTVKPYLTSEQIKQLIGKGFTFGAHSIDHPDFRFLSEDEQFRQTKESLDFICTNFNLDYRVFSFPFTDYGVKKSFFNTLFNNHIADLTFGSAGIKRDSVKFNFQRFSAESKNPRMKEILNRELQYYMFLKLLGKNIIHRY